MTSDLESQVEQTWSELLNAWRAGNTADSVAIAQSHTQFAGLVPLVDGTGPLVIGQLGQSLDGRIAAQNGESRYINGQDALSHLHRLRALVDAVVVGAGTVAQDDPRLTVYRVSGDNPSRVVIDPRARLSGACQLFNDNAAPTLKVIGEGVPHTSPDDIVLPIDSDGGIAPQTIVAALADRGLRRLLIEGGAKTIGAFLAAGQLQRLHLLVGPIILGTGPHGLDLPSLQQLDQALRPSVTAHPLGDDTLFDCRF